MAARRGKYKRDPGQETSQELVESSACMAATPDEHTFYSYQVSLAGTLKNLCNCQAASSGIAMVEMQL